MKQSKSKVSNPFFIRNSSYSAASRGSAWRDNREFVGQIKYGACYRMWNPSENLSFGRNFRSAAQTLFMCQRRRESPFSTLPDDCIFYILNMMRWDWVGDRSSEIRVEQKQRRRLRRQQQIEEADAMLDEAEIEDAALARAIPMVRENEHGHIESDREEEGRHHQLREPNPGQRSSSPR